MNIYIYIYIVYENMNIYMLLSLSPRFREDLTIEYPAP
jgi:hypothetical protein